MCISSQSHCLHEKAEECHFTSGLYQRRSYDRTPHRETVAGKKSGMHVPSKNDEKALRAADAQLFMSTCPCRCCNCLLESNATLLLISIGVFRSIAGSIPLVDHTGKRYNKKDKTPKFK